MAEEVWGYLACRAEIAHDGPPQDGDVLYVSTCGTFGCGSAGYWWSRLGALLIRLVYAITGLELPLYALLYSDDGLVVEAGPRYFWAISVAFYLLAVMGIPLSWKKTKGGAVAE